MPDVVNFSDAGISDDIDRAPVKPGMSFIISEIYFKESPKYGTYAVLNAYTPEEDEKERLELNLYTTAKVLIDQLKNIALKYGVKEGGPLKSLIKVEVENREGENNNYMSFV